MNIKLKTYILGNYESTLMRQRIINFLESKYYDVVNYSMPDMLNPKLTASWEKGLDMVAKKEIQSNEFMVKLENYINSKFNKLVVKY